MGEMTMEETILIPLRNSDEVHGIIPYLEKIAEPGGTVVFVVRCVTDGCHQALDRKVLLEPGLPSSVVGSQFSIRCSLEHKKQLAENTILSACSSLRQRGVNIEVNAHSGSTKRVVKNYLLYGNTNFLVVRPKQKRLEMFLQRILRCPGLFEQPAVVMHMHNGGEIETRSF